MALFSAASPAERLRSAGSLAIRFSFATNSEGKRSFDRACQVLSSSILVFVTKFEMIPMVTHSGNMVVSVYVLRKTYSSICSCR